MFPSGILSFVALWIWFSVTYAGESPVVSPFMLPDALREGERASTICTIRSGDRPLEFEWKKDGEKISESSYLKIQSVPDSSILVIESVTAQSSGNYTCIVKNAYGSDRFTAVLTVTAPPVWLEEPQSVLTQEGETVSIPCAATGVPVPKVKWTSGGELHNIISDESASAIRSSPSGALIINKIEAAMKGTYICEADNGVGKSLKKTISISVRGERFETLCTSVLIPCAEQESCQ